MRPAPELCCQCGSPACLQAGRTQCQRPWISTEGSGEIKSYNALYLLVEPGYRILKRWKKSGGFLFDRTILRIENKALLNHLKTIRPDVVIPIPQRIRRSWELRGSPADKIARSVGAALGAPVHPVLLHSQSSTSQVRQAELHASERMENPVNFSVSPEYSISGRTVMLVDDFMTTGHTLRKAAGALSLRGVREIHSLCLGVRPVYRELEFQRICNLIQSQSDSKAIGQETGIRELL